MAFSSNILHQALLSIALLFSLLSLLGAGLPLPPFKSLFWLQTPNAVVGIYGACPTPSANATGFFQIDNNWETIQKSCVYFFKNSESPLVQVSCKLLSFMRETSPIEAFQLIERVTKVDNTQAQIAVINLGVAFLLMVSSLCLFTSNDKMSSGVVSMIAFITQCVGFGVAVSGFATITATSLTTDQEWTYWVPYFGPGLYLSGVALVLVLTCSLLALTVPKRSVPKKDLILEMDSI